MINLGDKKWGVKDSGLLAYKQTGSRFFNKDFDFSRASDGTYVGKDGLLKTAFLYNLIEYSQDFSQSTWNYRSGDSSTPNQSGYDKTDNATLLNVTTGGWSVYQNFVATGTYTFSLYVKKGTIDIIQIDLFSSSLTYRGQFNLTSGTDVGGGNTIDRTITDVGKGWYRVSIAANISSTLYARIGSVAQTGNFYIQDAQLVEGTEPLDYQYTNGRVGIPRIDFSDGVGALLLEPQRSNLLLQSNQFDTTWSTTNASVTSGQSGIYGSNDAWKIETTGGSFSRINQSFNASGSYTASVYAKKAEYEYIGLFLESVNVGVVVSLIDGSVVNSIISYPSVYADAEDIGNGWYKISISHSLTGVGDFRIYPCETSIFDENTTYNEGIYIQHAQLESGSYPTSIIETTTSAVTRLADVANNCGSEQDFNSEEGTLYAEGSWFDDNGSMVMAGLDAGNLNDRIRFDRFLGKLRFAAIKDGVAIFNQSNIMTLDANTNYKIAFRYKANDYKIFVNGVAVYSNTSSTTFDKGDLIRISLAEGNGVSPHQGTIKNLQVFTEALSDEELQQLTT